MELPAPPHTRPPGGAGARALKWLLAAVLLIGLLLGAGVFALSRYVQSAAFRQAVLSAAHDMLGSEVTIRDMRVSLFSGATLDGVTIVNPPGFPGNLLVADAVVVRYRLRPLLRKRLEIEQVSVERPVLALVRGEMGEWNYERLGAKPVPTTPRPTPHASAPPDVPAPGTVASGLDVVLPKLAVNGGEIVMLGEKNKVTARVQRLDLVTSVNRIADAVHGSGQASIETFSVADAFFARRLTAPVSFTSDEMKVAPLRGKLAAGDLGAELTLRLAGGARYLVNLQVQDADVERLLQEAGARRRMISGTLKAAATLEGTGGLPTIIGAGRAEILDGRLIDPPAVGSLALLLQVPTLRDLAFDECRLEFALSNSILQTPVIRLVSRDLQITGHGSLSLTTFSLDHRMTLALTKATLGRAPRDIRAAFTERSDGLMAVDFRVWGPYDSPQTDLQDRLLKGVTERLLRQGLRKLVK